MGGALVATPLPLVTRMVAVAVAMAVGAPPVSTPPLGVVHSAVPADAAIVAVAIIILIRTRAMCMRRVPLVQPRRLHRPRTRRRVP